MQTAGMEYLESRFMFGMVPGLDSTRKLCEVLGNPQEKFKTIHVVGTNGKGSAGSDHSHDQTQYFDIFRAAVTEIAEKYRDSPVRMDHAGLGICRIAELFKKEDKK